MVHNLVCFLILQPTRLTIITLWLTIQIIIQTNGSNLSDRYYIMAYNSN
ncbi:hypothetical protein ES705_16723 [subsurface metagenome]